MKHHLMKTTKRSHFSFNGGCGTLQADIAACGREVIHGHNAEWGTDEVTCKSCKRTQGFSEMAELEKKIEKRREGDEQGQA